MLDERTTQAISATLAREVTLRSINANEAQVLVPFYFADGDAIAVFLRETSAGSIEITDKANTLQHLSYHVDIDRLENGPRAALFERIQMQHRVENRGGELVARAADASAVGAAVFDFVHAVLQVADLRFLEREIVRSTFAHDFERLMSERFPSAAKHYVDPDHDADGKYPVDFLLNGVERPVAVFGVPTEAAALKALVTVKEFRSWGRSLRVVAVEEEQESLPRRTVAWLSDTFDKQFSTLRGNEDDIARYIKDEYETARRLSTEP